MIVRTEAIVLHALDYGETSQIVSLFTRARGRISVMAKGSRRPKSRFGSALQPMSYIQVIFYDRPGRDLQTLRDADHVHRLRFLVDDLSKLSVGFRMVELVRTLTEVGDPQPALFNVMLHSLLHLDAAGERAAHVLPHFQLRLAAALGFAPYIRKAAVSDIGRSGFMDLATGSLSAVPPSGEYAREASRTVLRAFAIFARGDLETALRMRLSERDFEQCLALVDAYLRHHIEGRYPDRSSAVGRQMRSAGGPGIP